MQIESAQFLIMKTNNMFCFYYTSYSSLSTKEINLKSFKNLLPFKKLYYFGWLTVMIGTYIQVGIWMWYNSSWNNLWLFYNKIY